MQLHFGDILIMIFTTICNREKHLCYNTELKLVTKIIFAFLAFAAISILMDNDLMRTWGEKHLMDECGKFGIYFFL